ncbi:hypothetical protein JOC78_002656 [Bacillus ectoiniformans]|uniref:hypothetical protein n=1 Tax=Bacillus ectoiniformans TaxID=1494429 RepID=UPI00195DE3A6|nr:hypothetical protein [Bacillus ectoiniformans]MBM7649682.1 hypothetical protein [Bacillus ectoiniformans]
MPTLIISRTSQYVNKLRSMDIYLNGQKMDTIQNGGQKSFTLEPGDYQIYVKIDWCKSKVISVTLADSECLKLQCGSRIKGLLALLPGVEIDTDDHFVCLDLVDE